MVQQFHIEICDPRVTVIYGPPNYRKYSFVFCALHLDCSFYYLFHTLSHCCPMELQVIVGNDRGRCTLPTHMREEDLQNWQTKYRNCGEVYVEKFQVTFFFFFP